MKKKLFRISIVVIALVTSISMFFQPASAAIGFRAAATGNNAGGATTLSIGMPTGTVSGDVMVAIISARVDTTTITAPSGWVAISSNTSTTLLKSAMYYKVAGTSESGPYVFNLSASVKASGVISSYSGVNTQYPIMAQSHGVNASNTTMTAPTITTAVPNAWIVAGYSASVGTTVTAGSSMTLRGQDASTGQGAASRTTTGLQDVLQSAAGASGTKTMTLSSGAENIAHIVALRPEHTVSVSGYRWFDNQDLSNQEMTYFKKLEGISTGEIINTSDGGYATVRTISARSVALTKLTSNGSVEWQTVYNGAQAGQIIQTSDGGYVTASTYDNDTLIVKFSSTGQISWQRLHGGSSLDYIASIVEGSNGDLYFVATSFSFSNGAGGTGIIVRLSSAGSLVAEREYPTSGKSLDDVIVTSDGALMAVGEDGDGIIVLKFTNDLTISWSTIIEPGVAAIVNNFGVAEMPDGSFKFVGGMTVSGVSNGYFGLVADISSTGVLGSLYMINGAGDEGLSAIVVDNNGDYIVAGRTESYGAGGFDSWIMKFNSSNTLQWARTIGTTGSDGTAGLVLNDDQGITATVAGGIARMDSSGAISGCSSPLCQTHTPTVTSPTWTGLAGESTFNTISGTFSTPTLDSFTAYYGQTGDVAENPQADVGTPKAALNTSAAASRGENLRLRMTAHIGSELAGSNAGRYKLQVAPRGGDNVCDTSYSGETYADVTGSSAIRFYNNTNLDSYRELATNANDPTHGGDPLTRQGYFESNPFALTYDVANGNDAMWDFSLAVASDAAFGNYCLRMVDANGSALSAPTQVPELQVLAPTFSQTNYRFYANADSTSPGAPLAAQDTPATIAPETPFRLRQLLGVDTGTLTQGTNFELEYGEKVTTCSAATFAPMIGGTQEVTRQAGLVENNSSTGDIGWINEEFAVEQDYTYAIVMAESASSYYLWANDFGFSIPSGATIEGIRATVTGYIESLNPGDGRVSIIKGGSIVDDKLITIGYFDSNNHMGDNTELWNNTWSASDINSSDFGFAFDIYGYVTRVDDMTITVYYSAADGPIGLYDNASVATTASPGSATNPTPSSGSVVNQQYTELSTFSTATATNAGDSALWDFALTSSADADGKTYCFRVVDENGDPLDTYDYYPEMTFSSGGGGPTLSQMTRGGGGVLNGVKQRYTW